MSLLLTFLNSLDLHEYPPDNLPAYLENLFLEQFGVMVKNEGDLYLFKYNQLSAKWDKPLVHECRGIILRYINQEWQIVSRPFSKFFNLHEFYCPINKEEEFQKNYSNIQLSQKADGTCIQTWWDDSKNIWRASTLGTITSGSVGDNTNLTFADLFWKTLGIKDYEFNGIKHLTYLFELCTEDNRIVTKYTNDRVYLLGIRNKQTGEMIVQETLNEIAAQLKVNIPYSVSLKELSLDTIDKLTTWVEDQSKIANVFIFGEWSEGFVGNLNGTPVAKIKNSKYLALHSVGGGDIKHSRNVIIAAIFNGNFDDIAPVLTKSLKEFSDNVISKYHDLQMGANLRINEMKSMEFATRKDYALWVQAKVPKELSGFFFQHQNELKENGIELFDIWVKKNYARFEDYFKAN